MAGHRELVFIHAARRTRLSGYKRSHGCGPFDLVRPLSQLLSDLANEILHEVPVTIDTVLLSNQFTQPLEEELLVNQVAERLRWSSKNGSTLRLAGSYCARIETATNGLAVLEIACDRILSGSSKNVLLVGGEKLTQQSFADEGCDAEAYRRWRLDIEKRIACVLSPEDRKYCGTMTVAAALVVNHYAWARNIQYSDLSDIKRELAVRTYKAVARNEYASHRIHKHLKGGASALYKSKKNAIVADPLRVADMSHYADGAGALLLSREPTLTTLDSRVSKAKVAITGCAAAQDTLSLTDRERVDSFPATQLAAKRAYKRANFDVSTWRDARTCAGDPVRLLVEEHNTSIPLTLINLQDLLLFHSHDDVLDALRQQDFCDEHRPTWSLNPSGGLLEGHPFGGTAIIKVTESFFRLRGNEFDSAIVHSSSGMGANTAVAVLDALDDSGEPKRRGIESFLSANTSPRFLTARHGGQALPRNSEGSVVSLTRFKPRDQPLAKFSRFLKDGKLVLALIRMNDKIGYAMWHPGSGQQPLTEEFFREDIEVEIYRDNDVAFFKVKKTRLREYPQFRPVELG